MATLHERSVVALLLVRAVEEGDPSFFSPEVVSEAALAAIDARTDVELLEKRTGYLFFHLPAAIRGWARIALFPENSLGLVLPATFAIGVLSNYLGPSGLVHVAYNPLGFLICWNLAVYALFASRRIMRGDGGRRIVRVTPRPEPGARDAMPPEDGSAAGAGLVRWVLPSLWIAFNRWTLRLRSLGNRVKHAGAISAAFWSAYLDAARPVLVARVEALVHLGAIGLVLGAIVGTYVRGLFFEYDAVWRSTFVTDASSIALFLNLLLGPACVVLDGSLLGAAQVEPLLAPEGMAAAPWIHRLALTAGLVVVVPRAVLAGVAVRRARRTADRLEVDLSEPYFLEKLAASREGQVHRIREGVATAIRLELGKFAESVALLVRGQFFDKVVVPALFRFRNHGGRIAALEAELREQQMRFEPELLRHLGQEQAQLRDSVQAAIAAVVGRELSHGSGFVGEPTPSSVRIGQSLTGAVATGVGDVIGATVTAAVATAVATISGGIGETLGIALVSGLLGTTGPIGLLIGGVAAAGVVGGAYVLGRRRVSEAVKEVAIPAFVAAMALRDSKIEAARAATYAQVKREIESDIEPQVAITTENVLRSLSLAVTRSAETPRSP